MKESRDPVQFKSTVLIADRNPHVREFLRREFLAEGYDVKLAKNGREILNIVYKPGPLHLLIMDLDLPDMEGPEVLTILQERIPLLPVVLHTFSPENGLLSIFPLAEAFVEKRGNSVERLKAVARRTLAKKGIPEKPFEGRESPHRII
jgi:CheY-like chemotaxis protein